MIPLKDKKCFLLDMDGTIYLGNQLIPGAKDFLNALTSKGIRYIFLTNNSSKNKKSYIDKLNKMSIHTDEENVFTSGEATVIYLNKIKKGANVFLLGTPALEEEFTNAGFNLIHQRSKDIDFVVLGFDTTLTYEKLWIACDLIFDGVPYIATHPDFVCPLEGGRCMPDTGSMIALIKAVTGKEPTVIGKPNKPIVDIILDKYSLQKDDIAIVGDRLYTDIRTGIENGIDSILVMSGETTKDMLGTTPFVPKYVFDSVKDIIEKL